MSAETIIVHITENSITMAAATLPDPTGTITSTKGFRAIQFQWAPRTEIRPNLWMVRSKIGAGAWDNDWSIEEGRQTGNTFTRMFTDTEIAAAGKADLQITFQVVSISATGTTEPPGATYPELVVTLDDGSLTLDDIANGLITAVKFHAAVGVLTSDLYLDELIEHGGKYFAGETGANITANHTAADTTLVSGVAAGTVKDGAADGANVQTKITSDIATGTIASETYAAANGPITSAEKTKLETAFGTVITDITGTDTILIAKGTHANIIAVKSDVKTALDLQNVANLTATDMVSNGLTDGILDATTTAVLDAEVVAKVNALGGIVTGAITNLDAVKVVFGGSTAIFDSSGRMIAGGVYTAAVGTVSPSNIVSAISATGLAQNLDLSSIGNGTLNNIPQTGSNKTVTAGEKAAAALAVAALHTDSANKAGIHEAGANITIVPTEVLARHRGRRIVGGEETVDGDGGASYTELTQTTDGGEDDAVVRKSLIFCEGDTNLYFGFRGKSSDSAAEVVIDIYSTAGVKQIDGAPTIIAQTSYGDFEAVVALSGHSSLTDGAPYEARIAITGTNGQTFHITQYTWSLEMIVT